MWLHTRHDRNASMGSVMRENRMISSTFWPDVPIIWRSEIVHSYGLVTPRKLRLPEHLGNIQWCIGCCGNMKLEGSNSPDITSTLTDRIQLETMSSTAVTDFRVVVDSGWRIWLERWRTSSEERTELPATIIRTMLAASESFVPFMLSRLPYNHCCSSSRDMVTSFEEDCWNKRVLVMSESKSRIGFCSNVEISLNSYDFNRYCQICL